MSHAKSLVDRDFAASCYFRTSVESPFRKALLQITERCHLHCAHCFVSAGDYGDTMSFESITEVVIPRLKLCNVVKVTLTGGEPFVHPQIVQIASAFKQREIDVGICTSGFGLSSEQIKGLARLGNVHVNVSLDGFRSESHGKFRGNSESFGETINTIKELSYYHLLHGLLVTPNNLAEEHEYAELCDFAAQNGARYVLMNPLSTMGRGVKSKKKLASPREAMARISNIMSRFEDQIEIVRIRFPNEHLPLASCVAGNIMYVFVHGEVTVCPYLVFAARTPQSKHEPEEFIVGNILTDESIASELNSYAFHERYRMGQNSTCGSCSFGTKCGKGCPAAVISFGGYIGEIDREVCPIVSPEVKK